MIPDDYHIFTIHGDTLLAMASGEVMLLDGPARDVALGDFSSPEDALAALEVKYDPEAISEAYREFQEVKARKMRDHRHHNPPRRLRALCLNITHRCNLACEYCFAKNLTIENAASMDSRTVKAAFDFIFRESKELERLQVDFFGGEPLMVFDRVKEGVEYARELEKKHGKRVLFTLTTNATLLTDEIISFLKDNNISLILSLDGRKQVNDRFRKFRSGTGTYDSIIKNVTRVKEMMEKKDYYIRGTFTGQTGDILDTLRFFQEQGFYNVSLEPVSSPGECPYSIREEKLEDLLESYREAARWMANQTLCFYHFNLEVDNPLCLTRRITGCGAGVEYLAVDPKGDLYPCHQFIENEVFRMGSVFTGIEAGEIVNKFKETTIYHKEACEKCWARFYCGGGCHFQQYINTGDITRPASAYCRLFKGRLEAALWYNMKKIDKEIKNC